MSVQRADAIEFCSVFLYCKVDETQGKRLQNFHIFSLHNVTERSLNCHWLCKTCDIKYCTLLYKF